MDSALPSQHTILYGSSEQLKNFCRHSRESGNPFCFLDRRDKIKVDFRFRANGGFSDVRLEIIAADRTKENAPRLHLGA